MEDVKTIVLGKNVDLTIVRDERFKSNVISVFIERPLSKVEASKNALLVEVMHSGCEKYPTYREMTHRLQSLYGSLLATMAVKKGERHILQFQLMFSNDKYLEDDIFEDVVDFLKELIMKPYLENGVFSRKYVEVEKRNLKDRIKAQINDKGSYAQKRCVEIMCENEAYSVSPDGDLDLIDAIDAEGLYEHYKYIMNNSKFKVFVEGNVDFDRCEKLIREGFGHDVSEVAPYTRETYKRDVVEPRVVEESMDVTQGKLVMGFATDIDVSDNDAYIPLEVGVNLFGGGAHSLLFGNVREKNSLCYSIGAGIHQLKGLMLVSSGIEFESFDKVREMVMDNLELVKNMDYSDSLLEFSKKAIINTYRTSLDNLGGKLGYVYSMYISGRDIEPQELYDRINRVTKEDIVEAFKNIRLETVYFLKGKDVE